MFANERINDKMTDMVTKSSSVAQIQINQSIFFGEDKFKKYIT